MAPAGAEPLPNHRFIGSFTFNDSFMLRRTSARNRMTWTSSSFPMAQVARPGARQSVDLIASSGEQVYLSGFFLRKYVARKVFCFTVC